MARQVSRSYGKGANRLVIKNVPGIHCPHCGESYLTDETLHEIEHIRRQCKTYAQTAEDKQREKEALEWAEATLRDVADEVR